MKINKKKYELARARSCMGFKDIVKAGMPKGTLCRIIGGDDVRPETIGKLAEILKVDVLDILEDE